MTLIYQNQERAAGEPGLHALLIGVADYPHLPGRHNDAKKSFGLEQIRSPEPTIRAIAQWLQQDYDNDSRPLMSIELLLSSPSSDGSTERATMDAIMAAFQRWLERCSKNEKNIAFFYFCGHGLNKNTQLILPEDFGNPGRDLWWNCIDFDATRSHMRGCAAGTQLFFVDACASMPRALLEEEPRGHQLISTEFSIKEPVTGIYSAASHGHAAFAPKDGLTFFSQALLKCLEGVGSVQQPDDRWVVRVSKLASHMNDVLERTERLYRVKLHYSQRVMGDDVLHHVKQPLVLTWLDCRRMQHSAMSMQSDAHPGAGRVRTDDPPWRDELPPGQWKFAATFLTSPPYNWTAYLTPPCYEHPIPA